MKRADLVLVLAAVGAVVLASVAVSVLVERNVTTIEFLFVALPTMFVLALCWQASKYYIILSEDETKEWDAPVYQEGDDATPTVGEFNSEPEPTEQTEERRAQSQE